MFPSDQVAVPRFSSVTPVRFFWVVSRVSVSVTMKVPEPFSVPPDHVMSAIVISADASSVPPVTTRLAPTLEALRKVNAPLATVRLSPALSE